MAPSAKKSRFVKSISKVRKTELMKKQDFLKKNGTNTARSNASSNKRVAVQPLKRKRQHEKKQQQNVTDFADNDMEDVGQIFFSAMSTAAKAMKAAHKNMNVDKVHDLMEEISEQNELAKKISEAVSNHIGFGNDIIDKADLEAELAALKEEIINEKLITVGPTLGTRLSEAPKDTIPVHQNKKKDDDEIAELESWATS